MDNPQTFPCRDVTADEIAHYREHGWVRLPALVHGDLVKLLLAIGHERMGPDGDSNPARAASTPYFNPEFIGGMTHPQVRPLIEGLGRNAKAMMGRRPGVEVRLFTDYLNPKLPSNRPSDHAGNGPTSMHQDYINWGLDRSGGMTIWIALVDLAPDMGTMSYLDGSHRMGTLGNYAAYGNGDLLDAYPELRESCPTVGPLHYAAGDATMHSNLAVHGAGPNLTDRPRWAYSVLVNPSDACWTGAPAEAYDTSGMTLLQELDDARFPVISR